MNTSRASSASRAKTIKKSTLKNGIKKKKPSSSSSRKMVNSATPAPLQPPETADIQEPVATAPATADIQEPAVTATELQEPAVTATELQELAEIPPQPPQVMQESAAAAATELPSAPTELQPQVMQESVELQPASLEMQEPVAKMPPQVIQESENAQPLEMSGQEQEQVQLQESVEDVKPVVAEGEKDPIRDALVKQLDEIKQQTKVIEDALNETIPAATGGMMKKRRKTFYKRYKSKKSMKRRNKTSRNN